TSSPFLSFLPPLRPFAMACSLTAGRTPAPAFHTEGSAAGPQIGGRPAPPGAGRLPPPAGPARSPPARGGRTTDPRPPRAPRPVRRSAGGPPGRVRGASSPCGPRGIPPRWKEDNDDHGPRLVLAAGLPEGTGHHGRARSPPPRAAARRDHAAGPSRPADRRA